MRFFKLASFVLWLIFWMFPCKAQWQDQFNYDWKLQNKWSGMPASFTIDQDKLRSNCDTSNIEFYISRPMEWHTEMEWHFEVDLRMNTSSLNYLDFYLCSDTMNLINGRSGYFVRIGNTRDEIALYKTRQGSSSIMLIDGRDNLTDGKGLAIGVKVTRNKEGLWKLYTDLGVTGSFFLEGEAIDLQFDKGSYCGVLIKQSTSSFHKKHYLDNMYVGPFIIDTVAPYVKSFEVLADTLLHIVFSEPVIFSASIDSVFLISNSHISVYPVIDNQSFDISLKPPLKRKENYQCNIHFVEDLVGNSMTDTTIMFQFTQPENAYYHAILITEIFVDPEPSVGLPEAEYIEIYNNHNEPFQLNNLRLSDPGKTSTLGNYILQPGEYLIICDTSNRQLFSNYTNVLAVTGMPSLNNSSDSLWLKDATGTLIDAVFYSDQWYKDNSKATGGWSLERIDTAWQCETERNWKASENISGGTPGARNSVSGVIIDSISPEVISVFVTGQDTLVIILSEPIDSFERLNNHRIYSKEFDVISSWFEFKSKPILYLLINKPLEKGRIYHLDRLDLVDCSGNEKSWSEVEIILPDSAEVGDIIINELLFNPKEGGVDFIEVYNISHKNIDISKMQLANKNDVGICENICELTANVKILKPGQFMVFSVSSEKIISQFDHRDEKCFVQIQKMPTMNNTKGNVWLQNISGLDIDGVNYSESMHHDLIENARGVSLEKLQPFKSGMLNNNWSSAASAVNYGTPGLKNSQYFESVSIQNMLKLTNHIISPDGDGYQDILPIEVITEREGLILNLSLMDISGRKVKTITSNDLLGAYGLYHWDGTDDAGIKCPLGVYVLYAEIWGPEINISRVKLPVTMGGVLNR